MFGDAVRFDGGNLSLNDPTLTPTGEVLLSRSRGGERTWFTAR